ncbi:MAG: hypothetical protein COB46_14350 [Rhodospirillaceae bacterium]|nr:MAG: hypothetical protein COB46_14350 [Rhodospirillaceae bacterium]
MPLNRTTVTHFLIESMRDKHGHGNLTLLLNDVITACKVISDQVNHGELVGALGSAGTENIQGETQKKLDILSNDIFLQFNSFGGHSMAL